MVTAITIKCDWAGCGATLTFAFRTLQPGCGWKVETDGVYSLHLCPKHSRKTWDDVRMGQFRDNMDKAHSTPDSS